MHVLSHETQSRRRPSGPDGVVVAGDVCVGGMEAALGLQDALTDDRALTIALAERAKAMPQQRQIADKGLQRWLVAVGDLGAVVAERKGGPGHSLGVLLLQPSQQRRDKGGVRPHPAEAARVRAKWMRKWFGTEMATVCTAVQ